MRERVHLSPLDLSSVLLSASHAEPSSTRSVRIDWNCSTSVNCCGRLNALVGVVLVQVWQMYRFAWAHLGRLRERMEQRVRRQLAQKQREAAASSRADKGKVCKLTFRSQVNHLHYYDYDYSANCLPDAGFSCALPISLYLRLAIPWRASRRRRAPTRSCPTSCRSERPRRLRRPTEPSRGWAAWALCWLVRFEYSCLGRSVLSSCMSWPDLSCHVHAVSLLSPSHIWVYSYTSFHQWAASELQFKQCWGFPPLVFCMHSYLV